MNSILEKFYGPNAGYVQDLYERYMQDPATVSTDTRAFFARWSPDSDTSTQPLKEETTGLSEAQVADIVATSALAHAIRERGHLGAHLDPLGKEPLGDPALLPETYDITDDHLSLL